MYHLTCNHQPTTPLDPLEPCRTPLYTTVHQWQCTPRVIFQHLMDSFDKPEAKTQSKVQAQNPEFPETNKKKRKGNLAPGL